MSNSERDENFKPDYQEAADVVAVHSANRREKEDPEVDAVPAPLWLFALAAFVVLCAGGYAVAYSGGWSIEKSNPFKGYSVVDTRPQDQVVLLTPEEQALKAGKKVYMICAQCHGSEGQGQVGLAPPLAGSEWVSGPTEPLAMILLHGLTGPIEVKGVEWNIAAGMQPQVQMNDEAMAHALTYIRSQFGNEAPPVSPDQIAAAREKWKSQAGPFTAEDLKANMNDLPGSGGDSATGNDGAAPTE